MSSDMFWTEDPSVLFRKDRLDEFFPSKNMDSVRALNASMRFTLYLAVMDLLVRKSFFTALIIVPLAGICTAVYRRLHVKETFSEKVNPCKEPLVRPSCQRPTKDNPFMNVLVSDWGRDPNRPPACDLSDPTVKEEAERHTNEYLFWNVEDLWKKRFADITFHTTPGSTIPPDRDTYQKWLYGQPNATCKEDPAMCWYSDRITN